MWCACSRNRHRWLVWAVLLLILAGCRGFGGKGSAPAGRASQGPRAPSPSPTFAATATPTAIPRRWDALDCTGQERLLAALAPVTPTDRALAQAGVQVLCAIRAGRWDLVADYVHPRTGLRFSPDAYLSAEDVHIPAGQVAGLARDPTPRTWGYEAGSGRAIVGTFAQYAAAYVYDGPYWEQGRAALDARQGAGNILDNTAEVFPAARVVEFHLPGSPAYSGLDWRSLRLVFVPGTELPQGLPGTWCLVAIVHDDWTP